MKKLKCSVLTSFYYQGVQPSNGIFIFKEFSKGDQVGIYPIVFIFGVHLVRGGAPLWAIAVAQHILFGRQIRHKVQGMHSR